MWAMIGKELEEFELVLGGADGSHVYALWNSNPRFIAHKNIALTTEL